MKKSFLFTLSLLTALSSQAAPLCYQITNPQVIVIAELNEQDEVVASEAAHTASIRVNDEAQGSNMYSNLTLGAVSTRYSFSTVATSFNLQSNDRNYQVDCDGGNVSLSQENGQLVLKSDRLTGDITKNNGEGCSTGLISITGSAVLTPIQCKTEK